VPQTDHKDGVYSSLDTLIVHHMLYEVVLPNSIIVRGALRVELYQSFITNNEYADIAQSSPHQR
jgi:hypothetical protein